MIRLTTERVRRGWPKAELARRARLDQANLSRIESGRARPYPEVVPAEAHAEAATGITGGSAVTRFEHATSGRQTPAKQEYLRRRRVGEWRRGESNPRPKVPPRARLRA